MPCEPFDQAPSGDSAPDRCFVFVADYVGVVIYRDAVRLFAWATFAADKVGIRLQGFRQFVP
jgi:hypothetical protein